jgi:hypothetical protein
VRKGADQALLVALACGATVENAARKAGLGERTAYRRLRDPVFLQQLQQLRAEMVQRTAAMLTGAGMGSVKTRGTSWRWDSNSATALSWNSAWPRSKRGWPTPVQCVPTTVIVNEQGDHHDQAAAATYRIHSESG